jgi:hypothetical protein
VTTARRVEVQVLRTRRYRCQLITKEQNCRTTIGLYYVCDCLLSGRVDSSVCGAGGKEPQLTCRPKYSTTVCPLQTHRSMRGHWDVLLLSVCTGDRPTLGLPWRCVRMISLFLWVLGIITFVSTTNLS